jgi:cell division septal protein FtsQ
VELAVTERTAVALVGEGEAAVLVDDEGRVLALGSEAPEVATGVVRLTGLVAQVAPGGYLSDDTDEALALATRLAASPGLGMELVLGDEVVGRLESGIEVRFGAATQVDAKVRSLRTVLAQVDLTCAGVIDVRSPGSPVLTREEGCS